MAEAKDNVTKWERLREYVQCERSRHAFIVNTFNSKIERTVTGFILEAVQRIEAEMDRLDAEAKAEGKAKA